MSRYKFFSVDDMLGEQYCTNLPSGFTPPPFPADAARIVHSVEPPEQIPEAYEPHQALLSDPAATSADGSIVFWSALKLLPANSLSTEVPRVRKSYKVPKPPKPGGRQPEKPDPEMTTTMQGKVKEVKSGDTLVLTSVHNPKQERILGLAFVDAPHFRRELGDEPYAYESRDYLIKHILGQHVQFQLLYEVSTREGGIRQYGTVTLQSGTRFPETAVSAGWLKVRDDASKRLEESNPKGADDAKSSFENSQLGETKAKNESKGLWASGSDGKIDIRYDLPDTKAFAEEHKGKTLQGVVERVITGDRLSIRFLLSPKQHVQVLVLIAGIRAPSTKRKNPSDGKEQSGEPLGEEATAFLENRILQRTLSVQIVGVTPQGQLIAAVAHERGGDMAGHILREGLARCVDHHSTMLGSEMAKLRQAEKEAKDKKKNLFRDHVPSKTSSSEQDLTVVRVQTADTVFVRSRAGVEKKINLSSVRQPKPTDPKQAPFQAEAKEYLRKRLIGKHVKVTIDGKKPASDGYEEREVATVTHGGKNIALQLVESGYATVIRHRRDDTDRSPQYDDLLAAEEAATKEGKGMHSGKPAAAKNYVDYSENLQKAKLQASVLQRQRKIPAIVDFVKGASRFVILIPRENAKLTLVLSCIRAPRSARNQNEKSEPMGQEALDFANRKCLQRDVEVDIEGTDKVGGFIGTLYVNRENFTKSLVEEGLASVHAYSAEQSSHGPELFAAEQKAKDARKGIWKDYDAAQEEGPEEDATTAATDETNGDAEATAPKTLDYREVVVTHVDPESLRLKLQLIGSGTGALEDLMSRFRSFHLSPASSSSTLPSVPPKAGDYVSAKFSADKSWYRARVRRNDRDAKASEVVYVDYGNEEKVAWKDLRALPAQFDAKALKPQAVDAALSYVQFPATREYLADAAEYLYRNVTDRPLVASVDHQDPKDGCLHVRLFEKNIELKATESVNADLVSEGLAMVPRKLRAWERSGGEILAGMKEGEKEAKQERRGMWEYGDLTED